MNEAKTSNPGFFITLEGVEGVGKTTNLDFIVSWLRERGVEPLVTREPGGTPMAEELRNFLLQSRAEPMDPLTELLVVFAARAQHFRTRILPALRQGKWVVCDRFTDATYAYQGGGRNVDTTVIATLEQLVQGPHQPDKTILLDMDVSAGLERARQRSESDRFESEDLPFFHAVRAAYLRRVEQEPHRFAVIDAGRPLNQVQEELGKVLGGLLEQSGRLRT